MEKEPVNADEKFKALYIDKFYSLPLGETIEMPLSLISSTTGCTDTMSKTTGPIWVYALETINSRKIEVSFLISDGNHRYWDMVRAEQAKAIKNNKPFNKSEIKMNVMKVIPTENTDIRYIFNTKHWKEPGTYTKKVYNRQLKKI